MSGEWAIQKRKDWSREIRGRDLAVSLGSIKLVKLSWATQEIRRRPENDGGWKQAKSSKLVSTKPFQPEIATSEHCQEGFEKLIMKPNYGVIVS